MMTNCRFIKWFNRRLGGGGYPKIFQMVWRMMRGFTQNFSAGFFIEAVTDVHSDCV